MMLPDLRHASRTYEFVRHMPVSKLVRRLELGERVARILAADHGKRSARNEYAQPKWRRKFHRWDPRNQAAFAAGARL